MWTLPLGTISNADPDSGVEANMYFDVDFNAYATNSKVSDNDLKRSYKLLFYHVPR